MDGCVHNQATDQTHRAIMVGLSSMTWMAGCLIKGSRLTMSQFLKTTCSICLLLILGACAVPNGPREQGLSIEDVRHHIVGEMSEGPRELYRAVWTRAADLTGGVHKGVVLLNEHDITLNAWDETIKRFIVTDQIRYEELLSVEKTNGWGVKAARVTVIAKKTATSMLIGKKDSSEGVSEELAYQFIDRLKARNKSLTVIGVSPSEK